MLHLSPAGLSLPGSGCRRSGGLVGGGLVGVPTDPDNQPIAAAIWFDHSTLDSTPASEPGPRLSQGFGSFAPH
jgi:hypothetical protein